MQHIPICRTIFVIGLALLAAGCGDTAATTPVRTIRRGSNDYRSDIEPTIAQLRALHADIEVERNQKGRLIIAIDLGVVRDVTSALRIASSLPQVDRLSLENVELDEEDVELLRRMPTLRWLNLAHTSIDDDQLAFLEATPSLEFLMLWATDVSDAGLRHIASLEKLQKLDLSATKVTGAGIAQLGGLKRLLELYIEVPGIGDVEIERLQRQLPETLIVH